MIGEGYTNIFLNEGEYKIKVEKIDGDYRYFATKSIFVGEDTSSKINFKLTETFTKEAIKQRGVVKIITGHKYDVNSLAISSDDVEDLLSEVKQEALNENFSSANSLLKKAKKIGINLDDIKETKNYISKKENAYYERKRKEKEEREAQERREEQERLARLRAEQSQRSYSSSSSSSSSYVPCYSGDTCFEVVKELSSTYHEYQIRCTKGQYAGELKCISRKGNKWSGSCPTIRVGYHKSSMKEAGNYACDW